LAVQQSAVTSNPLIAIWDSIIGKKIVMALTGAVLILFVLAHMVGNLKIFAGPDEINAYSRFLRTVGQPEFGYGQVLWLVRLVLLASVALHVTAALQLTLLNRKARPIAYNTTKAIESTWGARTMRWGGVLLLVFVVFHILHLTFGAVGFGPGQFQHLAVYQNAVSAFSIWPISLFYIIAMGALCLHLDHGIWSALQTIGWSTARNTRTLKTVSRIVALVVFAGFTLVPVAVLAGWVR